MHPSCCKRLVLLYVVAFTYRCVRVLMPWSLADGFIDHPTHLPQTSIHRAAAITRSALLFRRALKRGEIEPDSMKDAPHCMDSWR